MLRDFEFEAKDFLSQIGNDVGVLSNVVRYTELVWLDLWNRNGSGVEIWKSLPLEARMSPTVFAFTTGLGDFLGTLWP